jgi:hypothetical protein
MPRKQHKYHYIYKTTNLKNGKYYVGMHSTSNLEDGYLGSGDRLRRSIRKYGKENFKSEILEFFEDRESLAKRERELVNEDFINDKMCMNLKVGGTGGNTGIDGKPIGGDRCKAIQKYWNIPENKDKQKLFASNHINKLWKNGILVYKDKWTGRKHKEETKQKMSEKAKQRSKEKNSQFGTMWITNGIANKKIKKDSEIPKNWYKGRVLREN